ncbi:MAG: hypothetical protein RLZZ210_1453 [Pseudomonadota bacterium]|jgi:50S ribosomal protein L16 3-hydroxylase
MIDINVPQTLLGGLSAKEFMQEYWHKKPLLIKSCITDYKSIVSKNQLFELATQENVKSRLIQQNSKTKKWQIKHSPISSLPKTDNPWTVLVTNVNEHIDEIHEFMQKFAFIPRARLDDVMISYANDGGSVGAHFDTYDVFLFQGMGKRKWQISSQTDLSLIPDSPLKLLANFQPEQEWILEEGDMLYLPPHYAHHGVAIGECMTYSVGFRAPALNELVFEYFMDMVALLEDYDIPQDIYSDPEQIATNKSGKIPPKMAEFLQSTLDKLVMPSASHLLGTYLTKLNDETIFEEYLQKNSVLNFDKFKAKVKSLQMHKSSKANYDDEYFYINGERSICEIEHIKLLHTLADEGNLDISHIKSHEYLMQEVYEWYTNGWLV